MDDDLPTQPSLSEWQRSLQRLAAWMTRGNRVREQSRPATPIRAEQSGRSSVRSWLLERTWIFRSATGLHREAVQQLRCCEADEPVRQRLQIMHGRQYGNLHHLLQPEGRAKLQVERICWLPALLLRSVSTLSRCYRARSMHWATLIGPSWYHARASGAPSHRSLPSGPCELSRSVVAASAGIVVAPCLLYCRQEQS
jgi:hypothetical protein